MGAPSRQAARQGAVMAGIAGLALLAGCVDEAERFMVAPEIGAGSDLEGELTSSSPVNLNDGTRYSAHWLCDASDAATVRYELEAPFAAKLSAFDEQGRWLGGAASEPKGEGVTLLATPRADACTLLVVNGQGSDAFGPYRLAAQPVTEDAALLPGNPVVGRLEGGQADYAFSLEAPTLLNLSLSGGDGLGMRLLGEGVAQSAQACAEGELRLEAYLDPGDYRLRVEPGQAPAREGAASCASHLLSTGGAYRLLAEHRDLSDGRRNGGPLRDGDSITGLLEGEAPNVYSLHVDSPTDVSLALRSHAFDTLLRVVGEGANLSDDDGGNGTDSLLQAVLMPGDYRVEVDSYGGSLGEYALELTTQPFDGTFQNEGELTIGESLRGQLGGFEDNRYTFEVSEVSEVELALESRNFDPMLRLYGNGVDISDDDSGGDRNALITTVLQPGRYTLEAQSYSGNGVYTLRAEQSAFEGRMSDGGELTVGETVYGNLRPGASLTYRLVIDAPQSVVIESTSGGVDTVMQLVGNGVNVHNDDAGDLGLGSRISQYLEPGSYTVEVSGFGSSGGMVRLETRG